MPSRRRLTYHQKRKCRKWIGPFDSHMSLAVKVQPYIGMPLELTKITYHQIVKTQLARQDKGSVRPKAKQQNSERDAVRYSSPLTRIGMVFVRCSPIWEKPEAAHLKSEAMCISVSAALRCEVDPKVPAEQLRGIRCLSTIGERKTNKNIDVLPCPDAIARAIDDALEEDCESTVISIVHKCPDCGEPLRKELGCIFCDNGDCGYAKCG